MPIEAKAVVRERPIIFSGESVKSILAGTKTQTRRVIAPQHVEGIEAADDGSFSFMHSPQCGGGCDYACAAGGEVLDGHIGWTPWGSNPKSRARLWVRETWRFFGRDRGEGPEGGFEYRADLKQRGFETFPDPGEAWNAFITQKLWNKWRSPIHMPRWATRLTLEITEVCVERLQEITEGDAKAEGYAESWTETWWQGYRELDGNLIHQQAVGDAPPAWMTEPKKMDTAHLRQSAAHNFQVAWNAINGKKHPWASNPWVWVLTFRVVETGT